MFHLRSSFEAKLDERAIGYLTEGLTSGNWDSLPEQRAMFDALSSAGFIDRSSAPALDIRDSTPLLEVEVEVTNACDLRCRHCFVSHSTDYFPLELFEKVVVQARHLGAITLSLNGGEATLHPRFDRLVELAVEAGLRVRLFTNGGRIDLRRAKKLKQAGLSRAYVSLETFSEFHDWLRGPGSWDAVLAGAKALVAAGVEVVANPTITPRNLHLMDSFQKFALEELGAVSVKFGIVAPIGRGKTNWEELALPVSDYPNVFRHATGTRPLPEGNCPLSCKAGVNELFIGVRGDVFPCHFFADPHFGMGNLNDAEKTLESIYCGADPAVFRFREFPHPRLLSCNACIQREKCGGGCRGRVFLMTGDLFEKDPVACARFLGEPFKSKEAVTG